MKKTLALLLVLVMVLGMFPMTTFAAATEPNITVSIDKTEVKEGDTVIVTLGIKEMTGTSLAFGFDFDNTLLEATSVPTKSKSAIDFATYDPDTEGEPSGDYDYEESLIPTTISTKKNLNDSGHFGVAYAYDYPFEACYYENDAVITIKFTALKDGTVELEMFEDSAGTDGYKGKWTYPAAEPEEPECEHTNTKAVPNNDGTHNIVCTNTECGEIVTENVTCSGGTATCTAGAKCSACDYEYKAALGHKDDKKDHVCDNGCAVYQGTHADGDDANHTCDYCGKAVDGETCVDENPKDHVCDECGGNVGTHADGDDNNHTCDYCGGAVEGEDHTAGESVVTTTPATCTKGGSVLTETFCTECGEKLSSNTTEIPAGSDCVLGDPDYHWADDYSTCTAEVKCQKGTVHKTETVGTTAQVTTTGTCQTAEVVTYYADFSEGWTDQSIPVTGEKDMTNHAGELTTSYTNNGDVHTVTVTCSCGDTVSTTTEPHTYNDNHVCDCKAVETFKMYVCDIAGNDWFIDVPYGANFMDYIPEEANTDKQYIVDDEYKIGYDKFIGWSISFEGEEYTGETMPAGQLNVQVTNCEFNGWYKAGDNWTYQIASDVQDTGWTQINHADYLENGTGSDWYYLDPTTGYRAEDLTRVPYPTTAINGNTYAPDAEAMAYCESKGTTFIDATEAWFMFENDGKFAYNDNGYVSRGDNQGRLVDGMLAWHPGLIEVRVGVYAYFIGDTVNGGNIGANGDTYITKNNGNEQFAEGDIYNFANGVLSGTNGVLDGKYYQNSRLMMGYGLVETEKGFIYVRSNGYLATGKYYISNLANYNGEELHYGDGVTFGADGYAINGIVDGKYYVNGKVAYGAGVVETENGYIYVRSNGVVVKNTTYWITNVGDSGLVAKAYTFDENGIIQNPEFVKDQKNGIVDVDGVLYYYENGNIAYGAGLLKLSDESGEFYIYVKSNGQLATGIYWPTTTNGYDFSGRYDFGTDGKLYI